MCLVDTHIFQDSRANININHHNYKSNNTKGKVDEIETALIGFKMGLCFTIISTFAAMFG